MPTTPLVPAPPSAHGNTTSPEPELDCKGSLKRIGGSKVLHSLSSFVQATWYRVSSQLHNMLYPATRDPTPGVGRLPKRSLGNVSFNDMAQITLDAIGDAVLVVDPTGNVIYLNKVAETLTGWSSEAALGRAVDEVFFVIDGATRERAISPAQRAITEGRVVELALGSVLVRRDGTDMAIEDSAAPIHNRQGRMVGAVIVFHDARQSGVVMQEMSHLAQHDFLTGLPNRALLVERLTHAIGMAKRHGKQIALLFLDLDYFKQINDAFGHTVGDHLLRDVADKIKTCVRITDTVSRHGGDEFVILLTEIEERRDTIQVAQKLLAGFAAPQVIDGTELQVSLSIGISVYPDDGSDADTLMRHADAAMYSAKAAGRNQYQFYQEDHQQACATLNFYR